LLEGPIGLAFQFSFRLSGGGRADLIAGFEPDPQLGRPPLMMSSNG